MDKNEHLFPPCLLFDNLHIHDIELLPIMSLSSITPHINTLFEIQIGLDLQLTDYTLLASSFTASHLHCPYFVIKNFFFFLVSGR